MEDPPIIDYATPPKREGPGVDVPSLVSFCCAAAMLLACGIGPRTTQWSLFVILTLGGLALLGGLLGLIRTAPRWSIRVSRTRTSKEGFGFAVLGTSAGLLLATLLGLVFGTNWVREPASRIKCGSNLRQIGQAIRYYQMNNDGVAPPDFDTLLVETDIVQEAFLCPSSASDTVAPPPLVVGQNCSFHYFGPGLSDDAPATRVLATCNPVHHDGDGAIVLFADGSVRFLEPVELFEALADSAATAQ